MSADRTPPMSTPRVAAGALFSNRHGETLLVKPTYKPGWDIPGGYVEPGETPRRACRREVREELTLDCPLGRLLVVDWAPAPSEGDKVLFVFEGGRLGRGDIDRITLPESELAEYGFFAESELASVLTPRLSRRVGAALTARRDQRTGYLEDGVPPS